MGMGDNLPLALARGKNSTIDRGSILHEEGVIITWVAGQHILRRDLMYHG